MGIPLLHFEKNIRRNALAALALCALLLIPHGCTPPQPPAQDSDMPKITADTPVQESWKISFLVTEEGQRKSEIKAGHVAEFRTKGKTEQHLDKDVSVVFFDETGAVSSSISAEQAIMYENKDIEAIGNVVITTSNGTIIKTEYAKRSGVDRKIRSNRFVTIDRPNQTVSGYGFESDQELKHYRIFRATGKGNLKQ
ncbi:LPS export ABC transporter periplasmic protein LptC [Chlorobium phaeovibrioides]|uniref:LPS export ABC transporter periplasmic protein LptC n=1 Tax=Chlorobium phaeovibrioides TaxID=1094 RepID=A0ABW9UQA1_CHLPH|nr:LPS export ABC transporter periplasmic protein LptC [Chlorobium phaeovibrioides]MWV54345.1 LPS export ABC transporter periplasmic protein LptC [Chlorobium phaeovibrioides]